jgi:predicted acetyltransferase
MDNTITTYSTLLNLVDIDIKDHKQKDIATLFLNAMKDWDTYNQTEIADFINELKKYFGTPLTIDNITKKKLDEQNAWKLEAGSSIINLIDISLKFFNQSNFDKIVEDLLSYYNQEFKKVDFIAELTYFTTEQSGRKTPASSGYRPQVKFDFTERQTSGQQTFIDKEIVYPGDKVLAKIKVLSPDFFADNLEEGMKFEFREGTIIIGIGELKNIINDRLEKKPAGNIGIAASGSGR